MCVHVYVCVLNICTCNVNLSIIFKCFQLHVYDLYDLQVHVLNSPLITLLHVHAHTVWFNISSKLMCLYSYSLCNGGGRVIIMSIHQPRYSIFKQIDTLTLLSRGNMVYHGLTNDCLDYFTRLGQLSTIVLYMYRSLS